jgi:hypothetical protein
MSLTNTNYVELNGSRKSNTTNTGVSYLNFFFFVCEV